MLPFPSPLVPGTLIQRYKRFFADVRLDDGTQVTAHCANTGSMKTCGAPGDRVFLLHAPSPTRKLAYTWELTATAGGYIGVNTARPNHVVAAAVRAGRVPELTGYSNHRQEVKYGVNSRIDLFLTEPGRPDCYVEVKNTTLLAGAHVEFPDAVSSRGLKHLVELQAMVHEGKRAVMLFLVNRPEGDAVRAAAAIDPAYGAGLAAARAGGVEVLAYRAVADLTGFSLGARVPVEA